MVVEGVQGRKQGRGKKEVAGVEKGNAGGALKTLALPHCQTLCCVRRALLHLCHIRIDQCVCVWASE